MGLLSGLFKRKPSNTKMAPMLDGFAPWYSQIGTNIYNSVVVQQALKCIVDELSKLNPTHIRYINNDPVPAKGNIQDVLDNPNELMTTSEFLSKVSWMLLLNYNAFVIPVFDVWRDENTGAERRNYKALYPICPSSVDFIEDSLGKLFCNFLFPNGFQTTVPYEYVIHIRDNFSVSEYMGGNRMGQADYEPLLEALRIYHETLQGIGKAMKASYTVNGIVKYNTLLDSDKTTNAIKEFHERLKNSDDGILPIDLKGEFIPIKRDVKIVDDATLKFLDEIVLRNWGVSLPILSGDFTQDQYNAFFQKCLEPKIKMISQALTKKIFTERQRAFGNKIELYPKELIFMSAEQTLKMIEELSPTGTLFENEKRVFLGLRPIPELEGKRYMSLNWIDANNAAQYQVGKENVEVIDEEKQNV